MVILSAGNYIGVFACSHVSMSALGIQNKANTVVSRYYDVW